MGCVEDGVSECVEACDGLAVAATTLERLAGETMTDSEFADFLKRNGLTRASAAGQLGIARRLVAYSAKNYSAKDRTIPRHIMHAFRYLDGRIGPTWIGSAA